MEKNKKIQEAEKELEKLKEDEWLEDVELRIDTAERRGKEAGAKAIAKRLLEMKISIQDIMQATELTEEEIRQIQEENKK